MTWGWGPNVGGGANVGGSAEHGGGGRTWGGGANVGGEGLYNCSKYCNCDKDKLLIIRIPHLMISHTLIFSINLTSFNITNDRFSF